MKSYLVGGAVRDELLGREVHDRDYVVTGVTVEQMLEAGFMQVGADFPVFLHPKTKEEYALARTERKSGSGYKGFTVDFNPNVTLEEDLLRRDLTINAIAKDEDGSYVDPYGGRQDLQDGWLRHVSPAFAEDPLRVLRVARFAAQLQPFGFKVHPDTNELMIQLAHSGELLNLTAERVFKETEKALSSGAPEVYFEVLYRAQAFEELFPELAELGERFDWQTLAGALHVLTKATRLSELPQVRWAAFVACLALQAAEKVKLSELKAFSERLRIPNRFSILLIKVVEFADAVVHLPDATAKEILSLLEGLDAFRRPDFLPPFVAVCRAMYCQQGQPYQPGEWLIEASRVAGQVIAKPFVEQGVKGAKIKQAMNERRLTLIEQMKVKNSG